MKMLRSRIVQTTEKGNRLHNLKKIPSHESLIIHTTHSEILVKKKKEKGERRLKTLLITERKYLTDTLAFMPVTPRSKLYFP